ncbi:MAG: hypothetical protein M3Q89_06695 [Verrucomicrobiota bacterium]|nr:hypothetical protein [Verrucomicrobiota bacterium]
MALLIQAGRLAAQHEPVEPNRSATRRVAFAQHCFWTGEMKLGQIEGVVRTEAGFFQGREVTLVHFASDRISLEELARKASQAGVADMLYLEPASGPQQTANLAVTLGRPLDQTYRVAPASDQKKQIAGTPFAGLRLTPDQATKVNAFARANPDRALEWLAPLQREQFRKTK